MPERMTFLRLAEQVLEEKRKPLSPAEIWAVGVKRRISYGAEQRKDSMVHVWCSNKMLLVIVSKTESLNRGKQFHVSTVQVRYGTEQKANY